MRPNLMSPRRASTSGEDSILAMLEREPARKRGGGMSGTRLAWYGAGTGLALALTVALVWLAANNDGLRRDMPESVLAEAVQQPANEDRSSVAAASGNAPPSPSGAGAALHQVAMAPAAATLEVRPGNAAVIVDQPPPADAPPLRLLTPAPTKPAAEKPAEAVRVPVPAAPPVRVATAPARPAARAAAAPMLATTTPAEAKPLARPAAGPAKPKPAALAKSTVRPAQPKTVRSAGPARNPDGPVDADVALISAVIEHANGHAPEGSQMTELLCPNDACKAKPARQ